MAALCLLPAAANADQTLPDLPVINQSLSLADAIKIGLANNQTIKQSQADVQTSSAAVEAANAHKSINLATTTYAFSGDTSDILASSPGVAPENYANLPPRGVVDQNLILMAPLFTGGMLEGDVRSAHDAQAASRSTANETRLMVQESIVEAYAKALVASAITDVAQSRLDAENEQVRVTQEEVKTGRLAPADLLREQAEQADAQQSVLEAQNNAALALVDLKVALGVSQTSQITLSDSLDPLSSQQATVPNTLTDALSQAEKQRPDLQAALQLVAAARAEVRAAKGKYDPQIYAVGMADAVGARDNNGQSGYTVGITASIPLYDGGQRKSDVDAAQAKAARATADAQVVRQSVDRDVAAAWLSLQSATAQVQAATAEVTSAQQAYDLANLRYNAGKSTDADRLDALSALTRAQGSLAEAKANLMISRAELIAALG